MTVILAVTQRHKGMIHHLPFLISPGISKGETKTKQKDMVPPAKTFRASHYRKECSGIFTHPFKIDIKHKDSLWCHKEQFPACLPTAYFYSQKVGQGGGHASTVISGCISPTSLAGETEHRRQTTAFRIYY